MLGTDSKHSTATASATSPTAATAASIASNPDIKQEPLREIKLSNNLKTIKEKFDHLVEKQHRSWSEVVDELVIKSKDPNDSALMDSLVEYRDILDCEIFEQAARELFSNREVFTVSIHPDFDIRDANGQYLAGQPYYKIVIENKPAKGYNAAAKTPPCIITVKAPGSRNKTSDIDSSIRVEGAGYLDLSKMILEKATLVPAEMLTLADKNGVVEIAMIAAFNQLSEERYGATSSTTRDSNVYSAGFMARCRITFASKVPEHTEPDSYLLVREKENWQLFYTTKAKQRLVIAINHVKDLANALQLLPQDKSPEQLQQLDTDTRGVYTAIAAHRGNFYPKFNRNLMVMTWDEKSQSSITVPLMPVDFYSAYKKRKHQLELAASCVSLFDSFGSEAKQAQTSHEEFKKEVRKELDALFGKKGVNSLLVTTDFEEAYKEAEKLFQEYTETLANYRKDSKQQAYQVYCANSPYKNDKPAVYAIDTKIKAITDLYIRYLSEVVKVNSKIIELEEKIVTKEHELIAIEQELLELAKDVPTVEKRNNKSALSRKQVAEYDKEQASLNTKHKEHKEQLFAHFKERADLLIQLQTAETKANMFAYEGYINRSAVYHVVEGLQSGGAVTISKKTVMNSALQQLGFKLLHGDIQHADQKAGNDAKDQLNTKAALKSIYKTAKYVERIATLVFGSDASGKAIIPSEDNILEYCSVQKPNDILPDLKAKVAFNRFTEEEYNFLVLQETIIKKVKQNKAVPEHQKEEKTGELIKKQLDPDNKATEQAVIEQYLAIEKRCLRAIVAKMIAATYKSKIDKKQTLWGMFAPQKNPIHGQSQPSTATVAVVDTKKLDAKETATANLPVAQPAATATTTPTRPNLLFTGNAIVGSYLQASEAGTAEFNRDTRVGRVTNAATNDKELILEAIRNAHRPVESAGDPKDQKKTSTAPTLNH